jgi:GntR family transcriptional repressor for pyruvate dehydrogenase complex
LTFKTVDKSVKVSDNIISQIRDSILSGKLKPGVKLASEKDLILQFGVSKATMREALRVLEVMGLIEMKKGITGGAFVSEVDMRTTIHSIINFLHFQSVSVAEITMIRYFIEPNIACIAASKLSDSDIANLKKIIGERITKNGREISKEIGFHRYLARMAENKLLVLIIDFIDNTLQRIKLELQLGSDFYNMVRDAHKIILECLAQRDSLAAAVAMRNDILEVGRYISGITNAEPFDPSSIRHGDGVSNLASGYDSHACVVPEGHPLLHEQDVIIKHVGNSPLYLVMPEGPGYKKNISSLYNWEQTR